MNRQTLEIKTLAELDNGNLLLRIMLFSNDLAAIEYLRNQLNFAALSPECKDGLEFYVMRLVCSHIREALFLIDELKSATNLLSLLQSRESQEAFDYLAKRTETSINNKPDSEEFKLLEAIRNMGTFHYKKGTLSKPIDQAIEKLVRRDFKGTIERDPPRSPTRFVIADVTFQQAFMHDILGVPVETDITAPQVQDELIRQAYQRAGDLLEPFKRNFYVVLREMLKPDLEARILNLPK